MKFGVVWLNLERRLVQFGANWFNLVQNGAVCCVLA